MVFVTLKDVETASIVFNLNQYNFAVTDFSMDFLMLLVICYYRVTVKKSKQSSVTFPWYIS